MSESTSTGPRVSAVIPCHNEVRNIGVCLDALLDQTVKPHEIIVVDDASTDGSAIEAGGRPGVAVVAMPFNSGAAAARNAGAGRASGDVLFFVDADVELDPDAVGRLVSRFASDNSIDAVVGMYGTGARDDFFSATHNYFTHYNHAKQSGRIRWFWGAIGAVGREAFRRAGGFDERRWSGASAEDIELGFRLSRAGYTIVMDHSITGKHLHKFTFYRSLRNDFRKSALGVNLFLRENRDFGHKHGFADRANGALLALAGLNAAAVAGWITGLIPFYTIPILMIAFFVVSGPYLLFIGKHEDMWFTVRAGFMHLLSFTAIAFGAVYGIYRFLRGEHA